MCFVYAFINITLRNDPEAYQTPNGVHDTQKPRKLAVAARTAIGKKCGWPKRYMFQHAMYRNTSIKTRKIYNTLLYHEKLIKKCK